MDSDEDLPDLDDEFSSELFPDQIALDLGTAPVQGSLGFVNYDESTYQQLTSDRDDLRQRYESERRERERLQIKFQQEHDQTMFFEEMLSALSRNISSYEGDVQALRHENGHLKSQFEQLRSSMLTSMSSPSAQMTKVDSSDEHDLGQRVTLVASTVDQFAPTSGSSDIYKQEVTALAQENELFKQMIDLIDKQEQSKVALEENIISVPSNRKQEWLEHDDDARLEREKDQLEERIRELERSRDEQEKIIDEIQTKAEENLRMYKKETKGLESELLSQTSTIDNYEIQLSQMKQLHDMEILTLEERLEAEININKDLQTQNSEIERDARRLEEEGRELLIKIEGAYQAETEAIEEKATLEETYAREIVKLRRTMEEEVQAKTYLSMEIERLMAEVDESERIRKDMEVRFLQETQDLKIRFHKEQEASSSIKDSAVNHVMHPNSMQQALLGSQRFPGETDHDMLTDDEEWKMKLNEEVRRREALEEENKKLLYQINDILEQNVSGGAIVKAKVENNSVNSKVGKVGHCTANSQKGQDLEAEIDGLKERCRVLEKDARRKKELEIENAELCKEIEELSTKKNEMALKQKELMRELDNSLSSMTQIEDKNRSLTEEANTLSGKIRQMEYSFKNEKEDLMRSYTKDNSLQINELLTEKESVERKYNEQVKRGKTLAANIDSLETRIRELERTNERLERTRSEDANRLTEELNFERGRVGTLKADLDKSVEAFQRQTEQLEAALYENKRRYEEEVKKLEEEKHRIRGDLLKEKETYKRLFEEERQSLERRINEVQTKLGQRNATPDRVGKSAESYNSGNNESISNDTDLRKEVNILKTKNKELRETLKDIERKHLREIEDLEYNSKQNMMKVKREIEEDYRQKKDSFEKQSTQLKKVESEEKSALIADQVIEQGPFPENNSFEQVGDLIKFHNEQMDELKGHMKLQLESFDNEKQNFQRQLQEERQTTLRNKMKESSVLRNTVKKLTEEVKRLRQEKEILGNKLKKSSASSKRWANELSEKVAKISNECEWLRREKEGAQKSVFDLRRKLNSAQVRIYDVEKKHHEEIHLLEVKFDVKKRELDQSIATAETKLRDGMHIEYKALVNKEKGMYEGTMNALRKEIVSLQEQRHQLQTKLTSTQSRSSQASYNLIMKKSSSSGQSFNKSSFGTDSMLFGLRQMEGKMRDLEREVETLKREKTEIKVRFRQEKIQIQSECDQQVVTLEEKYRKQIEGLKRRFRDSTMQVQSSLFTKWVSVCKLLSFIN
ncbi:hypothetical protein P5673_007651 [Acropora cervicornis]|uniref:Uncharacterized protein n=1 Tax=Acropora cervicornis TaxID=6130 RepID=A0AAD9VAZ2_ACRCE|nr:hypothetical protein P5673_007651 [Acropora cervicornis]